MSVDSSHQRLLGLYPWWLVCELLRFVLPVRCTSSHILMLFTDEIHSDIPLILVAYLGWKYAKGTKFVALEDIPIRAALDEIRDNPETPEPTRKGWKGVVMKMLWE